MLADCYLWTVFVDRPFFFYYFLFLWVNRCRYEVSDKRNPKRLLTIKIMRILVSGVEKGISI